MTDKIKLKADKFMNDKKLKLNYIKPKDLKILLTEFCEEQIAELKAECDLAIEGRDVKIMELEHQLTHRNCVDCSNHSSKLKMKVLELEKENKTVSRKANEAIADKLIITAKYNEVLNDLNQENGKLQNENTELKEELNEWKNEWQEQVQKATDEGYARTLQTMQLTKAKKILQKVITDFHNMDCVSVHIDKTIAEAEQFLNSEVAK